jgi:hypothetical protein
LPPADDILPNPANKRKDPPNLTSKIPRKTNKADKALPGKKSQDDDRHPANKRKDMPNLTSKIPRKTNKADKASPEKKSLDDDPTSRIDPSEPILPVATLPNTDSQDKDMETEPQEEPSKQPVTDKAE